GHPVEDMAPVIKDRHLTARFQNHLVRDVTQVSQASKLGSTQIVDARAAARFRGEAPEPREGMRPGHIPGSRNVPFDTLLNDDKTMKAPDETRAVFEAAGVDLQKPIITSCGSGITAAILALALERMGHDQWSLYDGSWAEWGMSPMVPVATGDA
ncbi:MAG: sulfurtransferase, partial [Tateyamaria sp.]